MALKEDYKDAVFAGLRKYKMMENGDGTVSPVDMTEYEAAGDKFGAKDVNAITKTVNATGEIIADDNDGFKPDQKYVIGDIVIYDNKTWRFKVDHEPGEWDESHVEKTRILVEIAEQNKNFDALSAEIGTGIQISNELQTITLPFTAQSNVMMQIKIAHTVDDVVHYCYLKSNFYGNNYYSFVGAARGGATVEWFPVKKGDTISFQGASGATATYAVFS